MSIKTEGVNFAQKQAYFEELIEKQLECSTTTETLRKSCLYALKTGGKRLRPLIVFLMKEALGSKENLDEIALCVEFFHTASLIADDLPCMDNEEKRRNEPTTHKVYGEAAALLSSYALIVAAFEKISKATKKSSLIDRNIRALSALEITCKAAGIEGATGGQFLDLFCENPTKQLIEEIIEKKTNTLFDVAFSLGWIYSGGDLKKLEIVSKAAREFGFAFQLIDDIKDFKEDLEKRKKINGALFMGKEETLRKIEELFLSFEGSLELLDIKKEGFLLLKEKALSYLTE